MCSTSINDYLAALTREIFNHELSTSTCFIPLSECAIINGETLSKYHSTSMFHYLDTGNITDNVIMSYQEISFDNLPSRAKRLVNKGDVVFSTVRPNQLHYGILTSIPENCIVSTGFAVIRSKDDRISNEVLYLRLSDPNIIEYLQGVAESSTSTYPSITPNDLAEISIPILPNKKFQSLLKSLFLLIDSNQKQNYMLEEARTKMLELLLSSNK